MSTDRHWPRGGASDAAIDRDSREITDTTDNIELTDEVILLYATTADAIAILPSASIAADKTFTVKALDVTHDCKVQGASMDGESEIVFSIQYQSLDFYSDGSAWYIL